jgi:hypothetical protein
LVQKLNVKTDSIEIIGYAFHGNGVQAVRSATYRQILLNFFRMHGFVASARQDHLPDDDIVYMSHAKSLVLGGGGFSKFMGAMSRLRGGKVLRPASTTWRGGGDGRVPESMNGLVQV